jgi:hypothetical protein
MLAAQAPEEGATVAAERRNFEYYFRLPPPYRFPRGRYFAVVFVGVSIFILRLLSLFSISIQGNNGIDPL